MPYHPMLEKILDTPEIRELKKQDLRIQRKIFNENVIQLINQIPKPNIVEKDIKLGNQTILRHYQPKMDSDKAVLFIHGGGWCLGSIDTYDNVCRYLCDNGDFHVFSLEYGLAPEEKYPKAVEHSLYAYDWLYENATQFAIDPKNIFVMGDSAGGNLSTIICHERQENMPKAQILAYPAVDMYTKYKSIKKFNAHKYHLTSQWCEMFLIAYIDDISKNFHKLKDPQLSPIFYENTKQPDTLIIAATHDILVDSIYAYEAKLKAQEVLVETHYDEEMFHGFISTVGISPLNNAKIALDKAIKFIQTR
ncbi:pimeloyl-[acyl-carrier protein] methyl ester esterase [Allofrancisella inopinata]|uniref:Alpha/beta hydrolase n=1 Tax=Allofrancisella inopinata TaxID=1085647 RepID=A0AAE7CRV5_9GAMM|nr:pimeloyl-ACP methyl ester esterase BioJ [Allofrancisella inopinata]QIV96093.1 alpha/beta hydrolase [Allofrancisella inopinata]TDT69684.1 pimeloyl-[acyl-carrier protein] methyl ester esterase [Allofrancisella inopinata]